MHILFVNHHHLDSNSGVHIFNLANQLTRMGVKCTVCVPEFKETTAALGQYHFEVVNFEDLQKDMQPGKVDLIHAWTPRERVRIMTETLSKGFAAPYIVHLEDNEEAILQSNLGMPFPEILALPESRLEELIPAHLSHPVRYREFLDNADGMTTLMDTLLAFGPHKEVKDVIWPGYEENRAWHRAPDGSLRHLLNIQPDEHVIAYTGNVHAANYQEVFSLYLAVGLLNRRGIRTRLIRTGMDFVRLYDETLSVLDQYCVSMGHVSRSELPSILSIADVLVQPGKADAFNIFRFPSKLPEYLASGKPVMLPAVNIGRFLKDGVEAVLLHQGTALEIAQKLEALFPDQDRRERIGAAGRKFAEKNLRWEISAKKLYKLYQRVIGRAQARLKLQNEEKPSFSIIVFQMGKVGSKTVQESLIHFYESRGLPMDVYHSHILCGFDTAEEIIRRERNHPEQTLGVINAGREIRKLVDTSGDHQWRVITLVRDPVARNAGTFFQVLEEHIPDWKQKHAQGTLTIDEVQQAFLNVGSIHTEPDRWFDEQLRPLTGVDVYAEAFPRDTGYKIYNPDSRMPVLLIRLEDLDRIGALALQEFLGLENIELINTNVGEEKEYADLYRLFKQHPLPDHYLQEVYSTNYSRAFYTEAEIERFKVKWQSPRKSEGRESISQRDPIVVFQMGKVGSKTIEQSLLHYYQSHGMAGDIFHTHFLNYLDEMEADAVRRGISSQGIQKIREAKEIRRKIREEGYKNWRVISLVRDPVARNIAAFFQSLSLNQFVPDWKERYRRGELDIQELQDVFLGLGEDFIQHPANWFDSQMKPVFGIDVFADSFPYEAGYKIHESAGPYSLLVIRMEDINRCAGKAVQDYLGLTGFKILNSNVGTEKDYADIYQGFKNLPLPMDYIDKVYGTKYARHFYSQEEIDSFIRRWTNVKPSILSRDTEQ